ncbi:hypothetical protein PAXRUDRAFT_834283 [Paxillus rubicundulus Ve08.2h10]|uniref:Uncharacterized protein n=1 Tax=Paxillus rubicundulus Ve08.2h10 TaxID=930991 RepID=A0A0D0CUE8_9AGAM|nr:hypothetical protein PAXRUDRAFT_834283 [Paxillus rubicundulus Ve08.2h10]
MGMASYMVVETTPHSKSCIGRCRNLSDNIPEHRLVFERNKATFKCHLQRILGKSPSKEDRVTG